MRKYSEILSRIKWRSVLLLVVVLALALGVLWVLFTYKPFGNTYKGDGDILLRSWPEPKDAELKGKSTVKIEVKNRGGENADVFIKMEAYSPELFFESTGTSKINESVSLGPKESRELRFKVFFNASHAGVYGVKVTAYPRGEAIVDEVFFNLYERR